MGRKPLVIGGDDEFRRAIAALLKRRGCTVTLAPSIREAVQLLLHRSIPLALVDIAINLNGADVISSAERAPM